MCSGAKPDPPSSITVSSWATINDATCACAARLGIRKARPPGCGTPALALSRGAPDSAHGTFGTPASGAPAATLADNP